MEPRNAQLLAPPSCPEVVLRIPDIETAAVRLGRTIGNDKRHLVARRVCIAAEMHAYVPTPLIRSNDCYYCCYCCHPLYMLLTLYLFCLSET